VVVTENVTDPVGAVPELPAGGFVEFCVSTTTIIEKLVVAEADKTLGVAVTVVGALVTVTDGALVLLALKLLSPA
jgi:hypothetical protein